MSAIKIAPSILAADFARLGEQIAACEESGAEWIHVDVMDGRFVPNITFGPLIVEAARRSTTLPLDVHLMIVEPERYIEDFARAGADHITVHVEASPHLHRTLSVIRDLGLKAGVAINPHTPVSAIAEILPLVSIVNVMTVNPGFGGQKLIESTLAKFGQLRAMAQAQGLEIELEADGGVGMATARRVAQAGASVLIAGNAVFGSTTGIGTAITGIRDAAKGIGV